MGSGGVVVPHQPQRHREAPPIRADDVVRSTVGAFFFGAVFGAVFGAAFGAGFGAIFGAAFGAGFGAIFGAVPVRAATLAELLKFGAAAACGAAGGASTGS